MRYFHEIFAKPERKIPMRSTVVHTFPGFPYSKEPWRYPALCHQHFALARSEFDFVLSKQLFLSAAVEISDESLLPRTQAMSRSVLNEAW
jgi:hypothetical protein